MGLYENALYCIAEDCGVVPQYKVKWELNKKHSITMRVICKCIKELQKKYNHILVVGAEDDVCLVKKRCSRHMKSGKEIEFKTIINKEKGFDVWYEKDPNDIIASIRDSVDVILVITKKYGKSAEMLLLGNNLHVVDIYDELCMQGLCLVELNDNNIYKRILKYFLYNVDSLKKGGLNKKITYSRDYISNSKVIIENYDAIYVYKKQFDYYKGQVERAKFYCEKIIWAYFQIRDFENMEKYIKIYSKKYGKKWLFIRMCGIDNRPKAA